MMKRKMIAVCALMLLVFVPALAEPYTYSSDQTPLVFFDCEDFDSELPGLLSGVFDEWLEEDDEIISGTVCTTRYHSQPKPTGQYTAIVRILDRREGTHAPWYQVQWDDKTGWVSGDYVLFPEYEPHRSSIALHLSDLLDE